MVLAKDAHSFIPMWIKFFNASLEYWSSEGLSELASSLRKSIHVDAMTEECKGLGFARICIEIYVSFFPLYILSYIRALMQLLMSQKLLVSK